jgi:enoyl-[acyl-carrier-protein] reductase (NADH)
VIHRAIKAEDCGYTVAFLLSELSKSITGQTIYVDNGDTIKLLGSLSK